MDSSGQGQTEDRNGKSDLSWAASVSPAADQYGRRGGQNNYTHHPQQQLGGRPPSHRRSSAQAEVVEEVPIQQRDIGRVIGKGGTTVKNLQSSSGAYIKIDSDNCVVRLRGTADQVRTAKEGIASCLRQDGDDAVILNGIDDTTLASLTRDMWLMDLQERLNVTVDVRHRRLKIHAADGSRETAQNASEEIEQRIADEMRSITKTVRVADGSRIRQVLADEGIKNLKEQQHLKMETRKDDLGSAIELTGTKCTVDEAEKCIQVILRGDGVRDFLPVLATLLANVPEKKMMDFTADVDDHIRGKYGVDVEVEPGTTRCTLAGPPDAVAAAKKDLEGILQYYFSDRCCSVSVPTSAIDFVCGDNDRFLVRLQGNDLVASMDRTACRLWLCGLPRGLERAQSRVQQDIAKFRSQNEEIRLPTPKLVGWIVGPRGENIRRMEQSTGATITVENDNIVKINCPNPEGLSRAVREVRQIISGFHDRQR